MEPDNTTTVTPLDLEENESAHGDTTNNEMLASLFHRAVKFMMRAHHHQGHAEHAQMRVLAILQQNDPMNQRELQKMLHVRSASLSELLGKLEARNFIARSRDDRDKRNFVISLTEEGAVVATTVNSVRQQSFDAIFTALSGSERAQLAELLRKVIASMEQHITEHHSGHGHEHGDHEHGHMHRHGYHAHGRERHLHNLGEGEYRGRGKRFPHGRGRGRDDA